MTLLEVFQNIEDPRNPSGRRYSLMSILCMLTAGLLSGHNSLFRIAQWCRTLPKKSAEALGFTKGRPSVATLSNILRVISIEAMEKGLGGNFVLPQDHIAIDGKSLRGTAQDTVPMVHLLSAFIEKNGQVLGQIKMEEGENEISAAIRLITELNIEGGVITGDAIFAKKKFAKL